MLFILAGGQNLSAGDDAAASAAKSQAPNPKTGSGWIFWHWNSFGAWRLGSGTLGLKCVSSASEDLALAGGNRERPSRRRGFPTIQSKLALLGCADATHRRSLVFR